MTDELPDRVCHVFPAGAGTTPHHDSPVKDHRRRAFMRPIMSFASPLIAALVAARLDQAAGQMLLQRMLALEGHSPSSSSMGYQLERAAHVQLTLVSYKLTL